MRLGTPLSPSAPRVMLLGAGELGKEVAIEAQRLGVEVIAADRYANAPAMQVAHRSYVINMLDPTELRALIAQLQSKYPTITKVTGHNQYAKKACPGFYVPNWLAQGQPKRQGQLKTSTSIPAWFVSFLKGI
jgi:hypothetical protein